MVYSTAEFEGIYRRCFPPAMRLAVSMLRVEEEARDVVQEVFLRLWESEIRFENPLAFVIRAVRNACLNRISMMDTREKIRRRMSLEPPPEDFDVEERIEEIRSAVDGVLSRREHDVVDRVFADGMSYKEAAESLDVSVAAVNKYVVSALRKLRTHFKTRKS